jgi:DNA topoisomerase-1
MEEAAAEAGLIHVSDTLPGIARTRTLDGFEYIGTDGKKISDNATLQRICSLAIPPAYENVWISPLENGHIQATARDARGRKQYRYHNRFREVRDESKFSRMIEFAESLHALDERLDRDLGLIGVPREKVLAAVVELLEKSFIRVGNDRYRKQNDSYGLTTLRNRHVHIEGSEIRFSFLGKSKIQHRITLTDKKLARVVKTLQDLPGQELFQFVDHEGKQHSISSHDVNAYLHEITGKHFTAKDFRTWAGTVLALTELIGADPPDTVKVAKGIVTNAIKMVAKQLGNTPCVCRKCYIHPAVLDAYATGALKAFLADHSSSKDGEASRCAEDLLVDLLKRHGAHELRKAS